MTTVVRTLVRAASSLTRPSLPSPPSSYNIEDVIKYIRYQSASGVSYGTLEGDTVREIHGNLFDGQAATGAAHKLSDVKLLYPCEPGKIIAVGLNYKSHLGTRPQPAHPEIFYKPVTALQNPADPSSSRAAPPMCTRKARWWW